MTSFFCGIFLKVVLAITPIIVLLGVTLSYAGGDGPPWPTPPPAPLVVPNPAIDGGRISRVPVPRIAGATLEIINPIPFPDLPRVPPLPEQVFTSIEEDPSQRIRIRIEAASIIEIIQLLYFPVAPSNVPPPGPTFTIERAFQIKVFDHQGQLYLPIVHRPWKLEVPISEAVSEDDTFLRLTLARYEIEEARWMPLVTSHFKEKNFLVSRIASPGLYALIKEVPPYRLQEN